MKEFNVDWMCMNPVFTVYIPFHRGNEVSAESSVLFQTINTTNALRRAMAYKVTCSLPPPQVICSVCSESSEWYKSVLSEPVFEISASLGSETCALWWSWLTESAVVPAADAVGVEFHSHSFSCAEYQYKHHRGGTAAVIVNRKQRSSKVFVHKAKPFLRLQGRSIDNQTVLKFPGRPLTLSCSCLIIITYSNLQTMTVEVHEDGPRIKTLIYALQISLEICRTYKAQIHKIN